MKTKFWEEAPGVQSMTRLAFAALILVALFIAIYQVITIGKYDIVEFSTMTTIACGLKIWQKNQEISAGSQSSKPAE